MIVNRHGLNTLIPWDVFMHKSSSMGVLRLIWGEGAEQWGICKLTKKKMV